MRAQDEGNEIAPEALGALALSVQSPAHFFPPGILSTGCHNTLVYLSNLTMLCCSVGCGTVFCYVIIEGMNWHPVAAMICRWYVIHILLRVILSPPTTELQLLMSLPGRRLLRKRCARSMFALFQQTSDLKFGDCRCQGKFPWCKTSSNLLLNMVGKLTMWDALVLLQPFLKQTVTLQRFRLNKSTLCYRRMWNGPLVGRWEATLDLRWSFCLVSHEICISAYICHFCCAFVYAFGTHI